MTEVNSDSSLRVSVLVGVSCEVDWGKHERYYTNIDRIADRHHATEFYDAGAVAFRRRHVSWIHLAHRELERDWLNIERRRYASTTDEREQ